MQWKRVLGAGAASAVLAVAPLAAAGPAQAAAGDASVTVVHGIPDTPVDVYVNGAKTLSNFRFKTVTDALKLPAGSYKLEVRKAGDPKSAAPILKTTADIPAGANITVVAALTAAGKPKLVPFVNNTSAVGAGKGKIVVRHTAAAPAVDVYAGDAKVISGLANPNGKPLTVPAGTVSAKVTVSGKTDAVIGPVDVPVMSGMATIVYAVGSASAGNLTAVTQQVALGGSPGGAQAGSGGGADDRAPVWPYALVGVAALGLATYGGRSLLAARA